jgi:hypothetical protein
MVANVSVHAFGTEERYNIMVRNMCGAKLFTS